MKTYADTSFLFSLYATDANSLKADAWRQANSEPLPFTALHRLEFRNALSLALFQQRITLQEIQSVWWKTIVLVEFFQCGVVYGTAF